MSKGLAERQIELISWSSLRAGSGSAAGVADDLRLLLFAGEDERVDDAATRLENQVVSQGHLFECAPAFVSVLAAAVADNSVPEANLVPVLDLLGMSISGWSDESEVALGRDQLELECRAEALKAYWPLVRFALAPHPYNNREDAARIVAILDRDHATRVFNA